MIKQLRELQADDVAITAKDFLHQLGQPTAIYLRGKQAGQKRAVVTLLHGNEPSGFHAVHRWLCSGQTPRFDTLIILASVHHALKEPLFSCRHPMHDRDLNRCFSGGQMQDQSGDLANEILALIEAFDPECIVDLHNSSGSGPSFALTCHLEGRHLALSSIFTHRIVYTQLKLGSILELSTLDRPIVTIECGGAQESKADTVAYRGLQKYLTADSVLDADCAETKFEIYTSPVRVELKSGSTLSFGQTLHVGVDLTLDEDVERFNFQAVDPEQPLGWLGERGLSALQAINKHGKNVIKDFLIERNGELFPVRPLKLFMATADSDVARSDCLFYAVCASNQEAVVEAP